MSKKDQFDEFLDELVKAVCEALDNGTAARLSVGGKYDVTIDIYHSKAQMKIFNETILKTAMHGRGMEVLK